MRNRWGKGALIALGALGGAFLILAFALQVPAIGHTIGAPAACGTCHVMTDQVLSLERGMHRELACVECHIPSGFFAKPIEEIKAASRHAAVFLTNSTPDVITATDSSRDIIQARCIECHAGFLRETSLVHHPTDGLKCFECHRDTTHGLPLRN
ncbi:cytochrome c3 family protein [Symbiobacterium thermophilum]|jgi:cytochrome c nitrite reductase small subunit|uniref:Cytochrome C-type protein n=1 Tax=Symbiobacterium thermophilum (strain DSM 24528 / JCM 14929 / IAM 14863 / T) TaxID=292459 RepID=Q67RH8_SYMTH|nr:NapC/NirT family cytochrome c [Symbiobacterium thermophilum]BAD39715.1 cytochrome C-type protein [Symbiobacterium thermophilum IAM 14863]